MFVSKKKLKEANDLVEFYKGLYKQQEAITHKSFYNVSKLERALAAIIAETTSTPNATVTRMVRHARAALGIPN